MTESGLPDGSLQWLHEGGVLAGQLTAGEPGHTAWVGIYPLRLERPETRSLLARNGVAVLPGAEVRVYRIRRFEVADELRETFFGEEDLRRTQTFIVFGDDQLVAKLKELGIQLDALDSARLVNYPL